MKNVIGIDRKIIIKEKIKNRITKIKNKSRVMKINMKSYFLNGIELYKNYPFFILFMTWLIGVLLLDTRPIMTAGVFIIVAGLTILNKWVNNRYTKFEIEHDFSNANKELDLLITNCLEEYLIMNGLSEKKFFSSEEENKMREEITNMVSSKISKKLLYELSRCYNEDVVYTIIGSRIYILITKVITYTNTQKIPTETTDPSMDNANMVNLMNIYNKMEKDGLLNQQMANQFK